jgi:formamidopyrimidine-DNA glycosylase
MVEPDMPELPEVETVVRGLRKTLPGRRILDVWLGKTDFIHEPELLPQRLSGARIESVHRHGKFLVIKFAPSENEARAALPKRARLLQNASAGRSREPNQESPIPRHLLVHLGMTGQLTTRKPEDIVKPHTHVVIRLDDGMELRYTDTRRFGRIRFVSGELEASPLGKLGAEPLKVTSAEFIERIRPRCTQIKALLLDQRVLRGMGNIYTDESLWRARTHPARRGSTLRIAELKDLHAAMQSVLREAIGLRGSSISDYVDSLGTRGKYQRQHQAYGLEGKPCTRCGQRIRRIIVAGRSSFFCPRCQRAPRSHAAAGKSNAKTAAHANPFRPKTISGARAKSPANRRKSAPRHK